MSCLGNHTKEFDHLKLILSNSEILTPKRMNKTTFSSLEIFISISLIDVSIFLVLIHELQFCGSTLSRKLSLTPVNVLVNQRKEKDFLCLARILMNPEVNMFKSCLLKRTN